MFYKLLLSFARFPYSELCNCGTTGCQNPLNVQAHDIHRDIESEYDDDDDDDDDNDDE